ncbi:hypothetical protein MMC13_008480 [Lambiella insularis]|nr:hypothetical protein [Lambiella insularis]
MAAEIWPIDIAESLSTRVEVDGFDLSDHFFPPASWLPTNVHLHLHDIYHPFPEHFRGVFNVVHLRLFLTLSTDQAKRILENATALLKPGGYVQWVEHDKTAIEPTTASDARSAIAAQAFIELEQHPFPGYRARWVLELASTMAAAGLEVVADDRVRTPRYLLPQMNELHLLSLMDVPQGLSEAVDLFRERYWEGLVEEYAQGVATVDVFICVVGRKLMGDAA